MVQELQCSEPILIGPVIMIIIIAVVIGGVAAAFFVASNSPGRKKHVETAYTGSSSGGSGSFLYKLRCTSRKYKVLW